MKPNKTVIGIKAILFCILFTALLALASVSSQFFPIEYERFIYGITGTIVALLVTFLFCKIDKITFSDLGLIWEQKTGYRIIKGFFVGMFISIIMLGAVYLCTSVKIKPVPNAGIFSFLLWALPLIPMAFMEELAFRGYPFVKLFKAYGLVKTQIIIAVLFALYHYVGGQSLLTSFIGPGIFALVFGLAAAKSGGIAWPTGIHTGANFILAMMGQHKGMKPIFMFEQAPGSTPAMLQQIELVGYVVQALLLAGVIIAMIMYMRASKK